MHTRFPLLDFDDFHLVELPARLASGHGALARPALEDQAPLGLRLPDGRAYTYVVDGDSIRIEPGSALAATLVEMSPTVWSDYAHELRTAFGLLYSGEVTAVRGSVETLIQWEPAMRAMIAGRPVYDPARVSASLTALDGSPLDLGRSFLFESLVGGRAATRVAADELRHFMHTAGFAHVRGVFGAGELQAIVAEVERLQAMARPGDDRSWWARDSSGSEMLCRLIYISERSVLLADMHLDERLQALVEMVRPADVEFVVAPDRGDGHTVVIKNPGAVEGLSDLPWHVDCGLGGHPVLCPTINVGIQLDPATAESGQLHFLAGSHLTSCHQLSAGEMRSGRHPTVAVTTQPGDVTMHFAHCLHAAPSPTAPPGTPGRRTLYVGWDNPALLDAVPPGTGYNDIVLRSSADNVVRSVPEQLR